jgi:hypothetical protein
LIEELMERLFTASIVWKLSLKFFLKFWALQGLSGQIKFLEDIVEI